MTHKEKQILEREDMILSEKREISSKELEGRQSGSQQWREERGEIGKQILKGRYLPVPS
jgi:hypothetical protein